MRYRADNIPASHEPVWDHSVSFEIVIWAALLAIIIFPAGLTWVATHRLEPYGDLRGIDAETLIDPSVRPLTLHVAAMDWKWMVVYRQKCIATVNEAEVMNAFYIPEMAGKIYAIAGMKTELNAPDIFEGFSANDSGNGFSDMNFDLHALDGEGFDAWTQ